MKATNNRLIVSVNMKQKDTFRLGDLEVSTALKTETNYREKSPVIARVETGNDVVRAGDILICHHNHFTPPSPYFLYQNLFSIPANHTIFAILQSDGELKAVYGNVLGYRVDIPTFMPVPEQQRKQYNDRIIITDAGNTRYKIGQILLTTPSAPYDIVYNWCGKITRITKVNTQFAVAVA